MKRLSFPGAPENVGSNPQRGERRVNADAVRRVSEDVGQRRKSVNNPR